MMDHSSEPRSDEKRSGGIRLAVNGRGFAGAGALAAGLALAVLAVGCGQGQAEEAPSLALADVQRQDLEITAEATGSLGPLRKVEVKSRASGEVMEVAVDVGDRVEPGTLLARIDPRDVQNAFTQAEADLRVAQEQFAIAEAQLERSRNLFQAEVITEQEFEARNLEFANARASLVRAEQNMEIARLRVEDVTIRSRMYGTILEKTVEDGEVIASASGDVSGGTTLMTIANLDVMQVRTLVDETDVGRIEEGMPATVTVDAFPDRRFQGQVEKVEPQAVVESNVVMFPVIVHLENEDGRLRPGMSAEVTVLLAERPDVLTLPNNAIVDFQEINAAAAVLGVREEHIDFDRSIFQDLTRELMAQRGEEMPERAAPPAGERGEMDEETRERLREAMAGGGDREAAMRALAQARGGGMPGMQRGQRQRAQDDATGRPGVVFVVDAQGVVRPRAVLIGVSDWSNSEILIGVEEGEQVALLGGAQLQAQRDAQSQRIRSRMGGGFPF